MNASAKMKALTITALLALSGGRAWAWDQADVDAIAIREATELLKTKGLPTATMVVHVDAKKSDYPGTFYQRRTSSDANKLAVVAWEATVGEAVVQGTSRVHGFFNGSQVEWSHWGTNPTYFNEVAATAIAQHSGEALPTAVAAKPRTEVRQRVLPGQRLVERTKTYGTNGKLQNVKTTVFSTR